MPLETGVTSIADLNPLNPAEGDLAQDGDNHIRIIKSAIKASFPNISGAVNATHGELNKLVGVPTTATEFGRVAGVTAPIQTQLNTLVPPGVIVEYAANTEPQGWLLCRGQAVSRTIYANLFAAIGTTYGAGDNSTTFNLPDLRGLSPRGFDAGRNLDPGRTLGSYQADSLLTHTHGGQTGDAGNHAHGFVTSWADLQGNAYGISETWNAGGTADGIIQKFTGNPTTGTPTATDTSTAGRLYINASHNHTIVADGTHNHFFTTGIPSGPVSSENRVKTLALNYLIKT